MKLGELLKGDKETILSINASSVLHQRFYSFGIMKGEKVEMKECSLGNQP